MAHTSAHGSVNVDERSQSNRSNSVNAGPNICLLSLRFGDGIEIFVNGDCTLTNFLQYVAERMNQNGVTINPDEYSQLDLVDEEGSVRGIRKLPPLEHVSNCLHHRMLYIPVKLEHHSENVVAKDEEEDWQILLKPHDAYFNYIEEAMLNIKEVKHIAKQPRTTKNPHGDTLSIKSRGSNDMNAKSPMKKAKK